MAEPSPSLSTVPLPGSAPGTDTPHGHLGLAGGTALYIAAVLGTGVLVLPALAAAAAGPGAILAVAALALISIPLASGRRPLA